VLGVFSLGLAGCDGSPTANAPVAIVLISADADTAAALGRTVQFVAVVRDAAGNDLAGKSISWTSTSPAVATVNPATGLATAIGNGSTSILATVEGVTGARALVVAQGVATVTVTPGTWSMNAGTTCRFTATAKDGNGHTVADAKFLWVSSNTNIAVVDSTGLARGVGRGGVVITAAARGQPGIALLSVVFPAGRLVVASMSDNAVYLYDPITLDRLSTFPVPAPLSAAVGPDGRIYAGTNAGQIVAIDPATGANATLGATLLAGPIYGTTVSASGTVYASGSMMSDVRSMDLTGASPGSIASPGGSNLRATTFGPDGSFYLTTLAGGPVQRWLSGFVYDTAFGAAGLTGAFGIATRASGEVIVTDQNEGAYFRFTSAGVFQDSVTVNCSGQIRNLAVDQDDNLWVGCYRGDAVVKFDASNHEVARFTVPSPSGVAFERP
jgi:outer membrane protein assembly factor BamB